MMFCVDAKKGEEQWVRYRWFDEREDAEQSAQNFKRWGYEVKIVEADPSKVMCKDARLSP